jgi:predicted metal-dependent enzyme (double-stranded beta helix superfamily)
MAIRKLRHFVGEIAELVETSTREADLIQRGSNALHKLIEVDDWLPDAYAWTSSDRYQQFLLYADARQRFSVVSFVWGPGQSTPTHDHKVWGLIGVLRGAELTASYEYDDNGTLQQASDEIRLERGSVEAVSPTIGDIHRVRNAYDDRVSVSIHVYGENIGAVHRSTYPPNGPPRSFVSGYSNEALPNIWDISKEAHHS